MPSDINEGPPPTLASPMTEDSPGDQLDAESRAVGAISIDAEKHNRHQQISVFWVVVGFAGFFALGWAFMLFHCFGMNHDFVTTLLTASKLSMLIFTMPLLAAISLIVFLMHYVYASKGRIKPCEHRRFPPAEAITACNDVIKSCLSLIDRSKK